MKKEIDETLEVNKEQAAFYDNPARKKNLPTRIWYTLRNKTLGAYRKKFNISEKVYKTHLEWIEQKKLSEMKVLDLGCYEGNYLSLHLARHAKSYLGIDLSEKGISRLLHKIEEEQLPYASVQVVDFLSDDFKESEFDLIYAYGVLHHFPDMDILIKRLNQKLAPKGRIIAYDPLETYWLLKIIRSVYRPFQNDKKWEWPFNRKTIRAFENNFQILDFHGILGASKWGIIINLLPLSQKYKERWIYSLIEKDWRTKEDISKTFNCMQLTMYLEKNR